jgi:uncharacterized BrkB/YihY/UPF0761 family membrane protein
MRTITLFLVVLLVIMAYSEANAFRPLWIGMADQQGTAYQPECESLPIWFWIASAAILVCFLYFQLLFWKWPKAQTKGL